MTETPTGLELTRRLIAFDTINPPGNERPCIEFLEGLLAGAGFETVYHEYAPGRTNLVARLPATAAERAPLVFSGHVDTVPLGQAAWSVPPFDGEVRDGRLYGRGASDMKSGVAASVLAALHLAAEPTRRADIKLVLSAGEETGCEGVRYLAEKPEERLGDCGALIVAEPTDNRPMVGHKGALWLSLVVTGVTAHGSMPEQGDNAVIKACRVVDELEGFAFAADPHPVMGAPTLNIGTISGGMNVNSVPDRASVGVDLRTVVGQTNEGVRSRLATHLGDAVTIETLTDMDHVYTDPDDPWMRQVFACVESTLGFEPEVATASYFSDASVLTPAFGGPPTLIMGPGPMHMAHQTDEYCVIDNIDRCAEAFAAIGTAYLS